jgi:hypothetical protein
MILVQIINTIIIDQLPDFQCVQESAYCAANKILNSMPFRLTSVMNEKTHLRVTLGWYLSMHLFNSSDQFLAYNSACIT